MSGLHADAVERLRAWVAPSPEQERLRLAYLDHLERHPDALRRECFPDHLTASTLVLSADRSQVLLTLHAKAGAWFQLGGHGEEADPTLPAAARREAVEESGLEELRLDPVPVQLNTHDVPFCDPRGLVHHLDVRFVAVAPPGARPVVSEESRDVAWWPADALPSEEPELWALVELARGRQTGSASSPSG